MQDLELLIFFYVIHFVTVFYLIEFLSTRLIVYRKR
jgi:hypothetical protein